MRTLTSALLATLAASASAQADFTKEPTLYLVGYSHLDTEWCWNYRHCILDCIPRTLSENFALFEKYPDYTFNWTGAKRYEFMKEYYPAQYAKLKEYVAKGRWVVTGSGWDECDANVPSPESIVRQVLYSNRFFQKEFGKTSNNYLVPDVFGFPASLPTILAHCGIKGMSTCKLTYGAGAAVPIPFNVGSWVGPDGSSIIAALNCLSYHTTVSEDLSNSATMLARVADTRQKSGLQLDFSYYGIGDEGGAPDEKSVQWVERSKHGTGPLKVIAGAADEMFDAVKPEQKAQMARYQGDLLLTQHSAGTATSGATMKRWNHRNELLADAAERAASAAAAMTGAEYPQARMTDAWTRFLGGQMHDILPGTSIPNAYALAWNDQIVALNESADVTTTAVGQIAQAMDTRAKGTSVVVYNALSVDRQDVVEADLPQFSGNVRVYGPDGREAPSQRQGTKVLFLAKAPSVGFAAYDIRPSGAATLASPTLKVSPQGLENGRYRVRIDAHGDVASVFDKRAGKELLSAPVRLAFLYQKPVKHPAWNMDWTDQQKDPEGYVDGPAKISVVESGPVRVALRIEREARGSKFSQIVRLSAGGDRLEFLDTIDWRSQECSLKAVFPLTVANPLATYNWEVGTVQRGNDAEKFYEGPSHRWFDLTQPDSSYGVSVLNEAKYGSDKPNDNTLRLTLLYTPGVRDNFQHQGTGDWGRHEILYALSGHNGDWRTGNTQIEAARLNQPLMAFSVPAHAGRLGRSFSFVRVSTPQVSVAALKKAEDSNDLVVRMFELSGQAAKDVQVTFPSAVTDIHEVNGQEQPMAASDIRPAVNGFTVDMAPYHPRAFAVRLGTKAERFALAKTVKLPFDTDVTSTEGGMSDGAFTRDGKSLPAELLPKNFASGGVPFQLGTLQGKALNAVSCHGQTIPVPASGALYFLAASAQGDQLATFTSGNQKSSITVQAWDGFVGQWDTRLWEGATEDEQASGWRHKLLGIKPGFVKPSPIAWYADHRRLPDGGNDPYRFCYLFRYCVKIPKGAKTVTLPNVPEIKILAATVMPSELDAKATRPLFDTLEGHS